MKAWEIGPLADIDGLRQAERDTPEPGEGEVLVKVIAAGLNYRDLMIVRGQYGTDHPPERIPLSDGVGTVAALGAGVSGVAEGERVIAPHFCTWLEDGGYGFQVFGQDLGVTRDGWCAEYVTIPAAALVKVSDSVSDATAATLAVVGGTVWHAMVAFGEAGPGKLVLSQGTGGVALFALQLAKAMGADFAITSSSDDKLAKAREMGADFTVNYRENPEWAKALLAATGGRMADVVVDTLGFPQLGQTVEATGVNARIGSIGALSGSPQDPANANQGAMIARNTMIKGIASGHRGMLESALGVVAENGIEMVVDKEFAFGDARAAYEHLASGAHMGKVLVRMG